MLPLRVELRYDWQNVTAMCTVQRSSGKLPFWNATCVGVTSRINGAVKKTQGQLSALRLNEQGAYHYPLRLHRIA